MPNAHTYNQNAQQQVRIEVRHAGPNDYRVEFTGVGEHSKHEHFGLAVAKMNWLASLATADIEHELDKVRLTPCAGCGHPFQAELLGAHGCPNCCGGS